MPVRSNASAKIISREVRQGLQYKYLVLRALDRDVDEPAAHAEAGKLPRTSSQSILRRSAAGESLAKLGRRRTQFNTREPIWPD